MKKPTGEQLTELRKVGENRILREYFQTSLDATKDSLVGTSDMRELRALQGQARTLLDILKLIDP